MNHSNYEPLPFAAAQRLVDAYESSLEPDAFAVFIDDNKVFGFSR